MENNVRILLLKIIKFNGEISPLLKMGYSYSQVVDAIKSEVEKKTIERKNGILGLTDFGNKTLDTLIKETKSDRLSEWIEPELSSKIPKIPIDFVFLPNQNELSFKFFD